MYKGQIIDELMAIVSSAEEHAFASQQLALKRTVASYSGFNTYFYELENLPLMAVGAAKMAAQAFDVAITGQFVPFGPRRIAGGIPEVYIAKELDNSRVVKLSDPQRAREMRAFVTMAVLCFVLLMTYAWQHFGSIEYGYRIEAQKSERDRVAEANRSLRLEAASLRDPERIDLLARRLGLNTPQVGQVQRLDSAASDAAVGYVVRASNLGVVTVVQ